MKKELTDHFAKVSSTYAAHRPTYPPELFGWLASLTPEKSLAWDCATGTGQAATALAGHFDRVHATDASESQIREAAPLDNVIYLTAPAHSSGLSEHSADIVTVAQALHWFSLEEFYTEVRRVLKPGGIIAVWTYGVFTVRGNDNDRTRKLLDNFYYNTVWDYWPAERRHVENGYADLPFPFAGIEAPEFAMTVNWALEELAGYLGSWSATSRYIERNGRDPVSPLMAELTPLWGEERQRVEWPLSIKVGRTTSEKGFNSRE